MAAAAVVVAGAAVVVAGAAVVVVVAVQAPMLVQTSWGFRLSLTRPSMMAGSWASIRDLQIASGTMAERKEHTWSREI